MSVLSDDSFPVLDKSLLLGPGKGSLPATVMIEPVGPCQDALEGASVLWVGGLAGTLRVPFGNSLGDT